MAGLELNILEVLKNELVGVELFIRWGKKCFQNQLFCRRNWLVLKFTVCSFCNQYNEFLHLFTARGFGGREFSVFVFPKM